MGGLESGQAVMAVTDELLFGYIAFVAKDDDGFDSFTPLDIGNTNHSGFVHIGMGE